MKKRIKQVIGVIIGIIIGISTTVGATTIFNSKDITYSSDKTSKTNVKDSLDELYNKTGKCPEGQYCYTAPVALSDKVELGDYIRMTPTSTSYTPPGELTGCMNDANCTQNTINPSELNLWRVIKKNEDGTIEVVSEYVSSNAVYFYGEEGYKNYIVGLNEVAKQYTNEKYVQSTRNVGYSNQILRCNGIEESVCPKEQDLSDYNIIKSVLGKVGATKPKQSDGRYYYSFREGFLKEHPTHGNSYWLADVCPLSVRDGLCGRTIIGEKGPYKPNSSVRPILTLKANVEIKSGDGKSVDTAYTLE